MPAGNVFRSWMHPYYLLLVLLPAVLSLNRLIRRTGGDEWTVPLIIVASVFMIIFSIMVLLRTKYTFTESSLRIGGVRDKDSIPYSSIINIENRAELYGRASTTIVYGTSSGTVQRKRVTPAKRAEFIARLSRELPHLDAEIKKMTIRTSGPGLSRTYPYTGIKKTEAEGREVAEQDIHRTKWDPIYGVGGNGIILMGGMALCVFLALLLSATLLVVFFAFFLVIDLIFISVAGLTYARVRYTFTESGLLAESRSKSVNVIIDYGSITSVTEVHSFSVFCNNPYAFTMNLIKIEYGPDNASVHIAPEKRLDFLAKLSSRLPDPEIIVISGAKTA